MPQRVQVVVPLADVLGVRLRCANPACGATTEVAVGQLGQRFADSKCPVCKVSYLDPHPDPDRLSAGLDHLQKAFAAVAGQAGAAFTVTDKG